MSSTERLVALSPATLAQAILDARLTLDMTEAQAHGWAEAIIGSLVARVVADDACQRDVPAAPTLPSADPVLMGTEYERVPR